MRADSEKLPVWRLAAALAIIFATIAVLARLAPCYIDNYRLQRYLHQLAGSSRAATSPDEALLKSVLSEAHRLNLPVRDGDVRITHPRGAVQIEAKYAVAVDFRLYQVDLHFR